MAKKKNGNSLLLGLTALFAATVFVMDMDSPPEDYVPYDTLTPDEVVGIGLTPETFTVEKFETLSCDYDGGDGDVSQTQLDEGIILPADCYNEAIYYGRANAVRSIETGFELAGTDESAAQDVRDAALLRAIDILPRIHTIEMASSFGANIYALDDEGRNLAQIIMAADPVTIDPIDNWDVLLYLHETHGFDLGFVADNPKFVWSVLLEAKMPDAEDKIIDFLSALERVAGYDLQSLQDEATGISLLHYAVLADSTKLLSFMQDRDFAFNPWDKRGNHVAQYASVSMRHYLLAHRSVMTQSMPEAGYNEDLSAFLAGFMGSFSDRYRDFGDREARENLVGPAQDFDDYNLITVDADFADVDNDVDPALIIAERAVMSFDRAGHIRNTSRVAMGVGRALGALDWNSVVSVDASPSGYSRNVLTFALGLGTARDYVIVSNSVGQGIDEGAQKAYESGGGIFPEQLDLIDSRGYIYYNSAGNEGLDACVSVDGEDFCIQNGPSHYHPITAVRVGGVEITDGNVVVQSYSNFRPAFCAALPSRNGRFYSGTSFAAPAAAAVEERLADLFARSASFPEGVVHEDILMALMLTADSGAIVSERTGDTVPVYSNSAGVVLDDRCGSGLIREQAAADLLQEMIRWTRSDSDVEPTRARTHRLMLDDARKKNEGGVFTYRLRVPHDGIITQIRAGIAFDRLDARNGSATLSVEGMEPIVLDLSPSGLSTDYRLAGHHFQEGDEITLTLTQPLDRHWKYGNDKGFVDLRMVQENSPIARAVANHAPPTPPTQ